MAKIDDPKFWEERGIEEAVKDKRPYVPWSTRKKNGFNPVWTEYPERDFTAGQRRFLKKIISQGDGFLIMRHVAPEFADYGKIYAELRPDEAAITKTTQHWHASDEVPDPKPTYQSYPAYLMADHIARSETEWYKVTKADGTFDRRTKYLGDHFGDNPKGVHKHVHPAKYVFCPSPYHWADKVHKHNSSFFRRNPTILEQHLNKHHMRFDPKAGHVRLFKPAPGRSHKWKSWEKNKSVNYAARVDIHPLARPLFADADIVYFPIEGCLKSDSVLSAVLDTKEKAGVLSVPAVSLWDTPEMNDPKFLKQYLGGKLVVIIPDADWYVWQRNKYSKGNRGAVIRQSRFLQTYLQTQKITAVIATTPREVYEGSGGRIKGIDDFLGSGRKLSDMEVNEPTVTYSEIKDVFGERAIDGGRGNRDGIIRDAATLYTLSLYALDGKIRVPHSTLARMVLMEGKKPRRPKKEFVTPMWRPMDDSVRVNVLNNERMVIKDTLDSLVSEGAITIEGGFQWEWDRFTHEWYWKHIPTITIAPEFVKPLKRMPFRQHPGVRAA